MPGSRRANSPPGKRKSRTRGRECPRKLILWHATCHECKKDLQACADEEQARQCLKKHLERYHDKLTEEERQQRMTDCKLSMKTSETRGTVRSPIPRRKSGSHTPRDSFSGYANSVRSLPGSELSQPVRGESRRKASGKEAAAVSPARERDRQRKASGRPGQDIQENRPGRPSHDEEWHKFGLALGSVSSDVRECANCLRETATKFDICRLTLDDAISRFTKLRKRS